MAAILQELINFSPNEVQIIKIPTVDIMKNPLNEIYEIAEIEQLAQSIAENGLLSPLTVIRVDDKYKLIGGERRFTAIEQLGWKEVSCYVLQKNDLTEDDEKLLLIGSNITRNMNTTDKEKVIRSVEEIYERKKQIGEINQIKRREFIAKATGYSERSIQDYLNKIHGKNEPTKLDIQKFVKHKELDSLSAAEIEQRLMQMGRQHHHSYGGMVDLACNPKGIVINNKDKITWKRCLKLIRQYVPLPEEKSIDDIDDQIPGQMDIHDIYAEKADQDSIHDDLLNIMQSYYPDVSHKQAKRIIRDIEILLQRRKLI